MWGPWDQVLILSKALNLTPNELKFLWGQNLIKRFMSEFSKLIRKFDRFFSTKSIRFYWIYIYIFLIFKPQIFSASVWLSLSKILRKTSSKSLRFGHLWT